jgi:hypothetical protein
MGAIGTDGLVKTAPPIGELPIMPILISNKRIVRKERR